MSIQSKSKGPLVDLRGMIRDKTEPSEYGEDLSNFNHNNHDDLNKSTKANMNNNNNISKTLASTSFEKKDVYIKDKNDFALQAVKLSGNVKNKVIRELNPNFHHKTNFNVIKNLSNGVMLGSIKTNTLRPLQNFLNDEPDDLMELDPGDPLNP